MPATFRDATPADLPATTALHPAKMREHADTYGCWARGFRQMIAAIGAGNHEPPHDR